MGLLLHAGASPGARFGPALPPSLLMLQGMLHTVVFICVQVPALMDTVACQCFINRGMLTDLLTELAGDDGRSGRTLA